MWYRAKKTKSRSLDITPLVDLVFLLIIFFLLSTTFNVFPGIRLDLPLVSAQKIHAERKQVTLFVNHSGAIYLNKETVARDSLLNRLLDWAQEDRDTMVLIKGDRKAEYGQMVDILATVKQSGLHRIAILTQPKKDETGAPKRPDGK